MTDWIKPVADSPMDDAPDSVATPEGDNEIPPDQPLQPAAEIASDGLQTPRGSEVGGTEAADYKKDHD